MRQGVRCVYSRLKSGFTNTVAVYELSVRGITCIDLSTSDNAPALIHRLWSGQRHVMTIKRNNKQGAYLRIWYICLQDSTSSEAISQINLDVCTWPTLFENLASMHLTTMIAHSIYLSWPSRKSQYSRWEAMCDRMQVIKIQHRTA